MKSILSNEKKCYICGTEQNLHLHHIYAGSNRKVSDKNGFWVYLCMNHHTGDYGVHNNPDSNKWLKQTCQRKFEETRSRAEFITLIGKNYV